MTPETSTCGRRGFAPLATGGKRCDRRKNLGEDFLSVYPPLAIAISAIALTSGAVGTTVTPAGLGFDPVPANVEPHRRAPGPWRTCECGARLSGNGADFARELAENELFELDLGAGIVNIDANEVALRVVIELHTLGNFPSLDARRF